MSEPRRHDRRAGRRARAAVARGRDRVRPARRPQPRAVARVPRTPASASSARATSRAPSTRPTASPASTGGLGVALTTTGPGAANTVGADRRGLGVALLRSWSSRRTSRRTQRRPGVYRGVLHESIAQAAMFVAVTKSTIDVADARRDRHRDRHRRDHRPTRADRAGVRRHPDRPARPRRAPTVDAPAGEWTEPQRRSPPRARRRSPRRDRPLLWVGGGARDAGPGSTRWRTRLGAPVVTTYQARGVLPADHPLLVGAPPHEPPVIDLIERADLAIVDRQRSRRDEHDGLAAAAPRSAASRSTSTRPTRRRTTRWTRRSRPTRGSPACSPTRSAARDRGRAISTRSSQTCATSCAPRPRPPESIAFLEHTEAALPADAVGVRRHVHPGLLARRPLPRPHAPVAALPDGLGHARATRSPPRSGAAAAFQADGPTRRRRCSGDGGMLFAIGELATAAQEAAPPHRGRVDDGGYGMLRYGHDPTHGPRHRARHPRLRRGRTRVRPRGPHRRRRRRRRTRPRSPRP